MSTAMRLSTADDVRIILAALEGQAAPAQRAPQILLLPNYPNPFNPETWIPYYLESDANVTIQIYNLNGRSVRELPIGDSISRALSAPAPCCILGWS